MDAVLNRRIVAVKTADAINAIEGVPVSQYAKQLSLCLWVLVFSLHVSFFVSS